MYYDEEIEEETQEEIQEEAERIAQEEIEQNYVGIPNLTYQEKAITFAEYNHASYPFLALCEEAGEVIGKLAKAVRKWDSSLEHILYAIEHPDDVIQENLREDILSELGDVQWQLAACCTELGITLEDLQDMNIAKLEDRQARNVITGEGDNR